MMLNNDYDDVIKMVNNNYEQQKSYRLQREESKKKKEARRLKKIKGIAVKTVLGIIIVTSTLIYVNANSNDKNINSDVPLITVNSNNEIKKVEKTSFSQENITINEIEEQKLLKRYCSEIYNVDYDIAYKIASKLTNNFQSEEYLQTNNPGFKVNQKNANSKEQGIILFLRHLSQKPEDFGVSKQEIINKNFIESVKENEESKVKHYAELFEIDPVLALAIEYHETGRYSSSIYSNYNNPAGLMIDGKTFWNFESSDAGIIEHIYQLKKNYIDLGYTTPEEIQKKYAPENVANDPTNLNRHWVASVNEIIKEIENNPDIFNNSQQVSRFF